MLTIVAAVSENGVIGRNNDIPWRQKTDLARFKRLTTGRVIVMGRKTFESILIRFEGPLPHRRSVVITRNDTFNYPNVEVRGAEYLSTHADTEEEIFVVGGREIYTLALPHAKTIHLTRIHTWIEGDVYFPNLTNEEWMLANFEHHSASARDTHPFSFLEYERL